ncbi:MAG: hypothetical protein ABMB14_07555 [Myxococcota bacterium]
MLTPNTFLIGIITVIASNYVVTRTELARRFPAVFWGIAVVDVVAALGILAFGVPGFDGHPIVRFMLGLVVLMHLAQNWQAKTRWDAEDRMDRLDAELEARLAMEEAEAEAAARAAQAAQADPSAPPTEPEPG